jgi:hypothetical protein
MRRRSTFIDRVQTVGLWELGANKRLHGLQWSPIYHCINIVALRVILPSPIEQLTRKT